MGPNPRGLGSLYGEEETAGMLVHRGKAEGGRSRKMATCSHLQPGRGASKETSLTHLGRPVSRTVGKSHVCYKPPSMWHFLR